MAVMVWQGWKIELPGRWNPVKLEGDWKEGYALLADLHRPRLGIRWSTPKAKAFDAASWARRAMREEVGQLAAAEAAAHPIPGQWQASTLYIEPDPPGRDVWIAFSKTSGRAVQLVHHAHRRERILADALLPAFADVGDQTAMLWAVFELSCTIPAELKLLGQQLNAGDLSLTFSDRNRTVTVRQIAVAALALQRMGIEQWLVQQQGVERKHYRPASAASECEVVAETRRLRGITGRLRRRRRWFWMRSLNQELTTFALHDESRDRLVIVQGSNESVCRDVAASVGWASV